MADIFLKIGQKHAVEVNSILTSGGIPAGPFNPPENVVVWSSTDDTIATVTYTDRFTAQVEAIDAGTVDITADIYGVTHTLSVEVYSIVDFVLIPLGEVIP